MSFRTPAAPDVEESGTEAAALVSANEPSGRRSRRALLIGVVALMLFAGALVVIAGIASKLKATGGRVSDVQGIIEEVGTDVKVSVPITEDYKAGYDLSHGAPKDQLTVKVGEVVFVGTESRDGWIYVHSNHGGKGWVPTSSMTAYVQQVYQDYHAGEEAGKEPQLSVKSGDMAFMNEGPAGDWQHAQLIHNTAGYSADIEDGWLPYRIFFPAENRSSIPQKADTEYSNLVKK
jgi:hypothetical protein